METSAGPSSTTLAVTIGGSASTTTGGSVQATLTSGAAIQTQGTNAHGAVLQSIGGGGGIVGSSATDTISTVSFGGGSGAATGNNASAVTFTLDGAILTTGAGASGILAQSIGGGGGIVGNAATVAFSPTANVLSDTGSRGDGGAVSIVVNGTVRTLGANTAAVNAQSIGGGGGIIQSGSTAIIGTNGLGNGGAVSATVSGSAIADGTDSVGVFATSSGWLGAGTIAIALNSGASVSGGTGGGAGIVLSGGADNTIAIADKAQVSAKSGLAILTGTGLAAAPGNTTVTNSGTVVGSVIMGGGTNLFTNARGGLFESGQVVNLGNGVLVNFGTVDPGGAGKIATTTLTGALSSSGVLAFDLDAKRKASDLLNISGAATIAGTIRANVLNIAPNTAFTVLNAGTLIANTAEVKDDSIVYQWTASTSGGSVSLSPSANFTPTGVTMSSNAKAVAQHFQQMWNVGGNDASNALFNSFLTTSNGPQYQRALTALSPELVAAPAANRTHESRGVLNRTMSCPVFVADSTQLNEDQCGWTRLILGRTTETSTAQAQGFTQDSLTMQSGVQMELGHNWFGALSMAYTQGWLTGSGSTTTSSSNGGDVSAALKYQAGPWLFAGALDLGWVQSNNQRNIAGVVSAPQSTTNVFNATGRLRLAYELPFQNWYLRPYADFDIAYVNAPGYTESGTTGTELNIRGASQTTFIFTPTIEVGGRLDLGNGLVLRPYASTGLSIASNDTWVTTASFIGAPSGSGTFNTVTVMPGVVGNLDFGLQAVANSKWEFKLEYGLSAADNFLSQMGMARVAVHF